MLHSYAAKILFCTSIGACATVTPQLKGQSWQTLDNAQAAPGLTARGLVIGTDPSRTLLYSVGYGVLDSSGTEAGIVRASADSGQSWSTLDVWYPTNVWPIAINQAFCCVTPNPTLPSGGLFAAGDTCNNGSDTATIDWFVRRSIDGGATWTTQDLVDSGAGGKAQCRAIQAAPSGDVYAAGLTGTNQGAGGWVWLVRKSSDGGSTWSTVDSVWDSNLKEARAVGFHPNGSILVAGRIGNVWTVRRSTDSGTSWTTVDSYQAGKGLVAEAFGIAVDSGGNIYVAGSAEASTKGKNTSHTEQWVVRRSTDGGTTWSTVDNFTLNNTGAASGPTGITIAPSGNVVVCGYLDPGNGLLQWIVRQGTPGNRGAISWSTIDNYQMITGQSARANGVTFDASGNIFVTGRAADATGTDHWITRGF